MYRVNPPPRQIARNNKEYKARNEPGSRGHRLQRHRHLNLVTIPNGCFSSDEGAVPLSESGIRGRSSVCLNATGHARGRSRV
jgi:hypothetical protein